MPKFHPYVEANYFANVRMAISAFGSHHSISNNIIINAAETAVLIPSWGWVDNPNNGTTYYQQTADIIVANNFIHSQTASVEVGRKWGYPNLGLRHADNPPERVTIANNIFIGESENLVEHKSSIDLQLKDNHIIQ